MLRRAIVRAPAATFADGLTTADLGRPETGRALEEHAAYCRALEQCGLSVLRLPADPLNPDSTFVEDTAVVVPGGVVLTRPGAPSRAGEVEAIRRLLQGRRLRVRAIEPPGTLDGGDVCEAGTGFFIGISRRTNEEGARQFGALLAEAGCRAAFVDVRGLPGILHLKSGLAWLGGRRLVVWDSLAGRAEFGGWDVLRVEPDEHYAANCLRVNDTVLVAAGFPGLEASLRGLGYNVLPLDMSEFRKMDGGLSCLSLRFETDPWEE